MISGDQVIHGRREATVAAIVVCDGVSLASLIYRDGTMGWAAVFRLLPLVDVHCPDCCRLMRRVHPFGSRHALLECACGYAEYEILAEEIERDFPGVVR